jgi:hypothetical protein
MGSGRHGGASRRQRGPCPGWLLSPVRDGVLAVAAGNRKGRKNCEGETRIGLYWTILGHY